MASVWPYMMKTCSVRQLLPQFLDLRARHRAAGLREITQFAQIEIAQLAAAEQQANVDGTPGKPVTPSSCIFFSVC